MEVWRRHLRALSRGTESGGVFPNDLLNTLGSQSQPAGALERQQQGTDLEGKDAREGIVRHQIMLIACNTLSVQHQNLLCQTLDFARSKMLMLEVTRCQPHSTRTVGLLHKLPQKMLSIGKRGSV